MFNLRNAAVSPMNQLLVTLRYYATGCSQLTSGDFAGISYTTAHRVIHRVSNAIASLRPQYVSFPESQESIRKTQLQFYNIARFPKVLGAMDCTHVRIMSPGGMEAETYRNRKGYFSLNVQAICNADLEFTDIVARWPGSTHDSTIFNNCYRHALFEDRRYGDAVLLVDGGYPSKPYLLSPLENPITEEERLYNESQIRSRNTVERLFGCWKRRFPVLSLGINVKLNNTMAIIIATVVLHNILRKAGEDLPPDDPDLMLPAPWAALLGEGDITRGRLQDGQRKDAVRRALISNYFRSLV
ncbi:putative nuclease HARBI1 [Bacillus rossius redtenbacheri]|uniref:putative nuclease HARBI1 n=1 Tax=Bacillus rossius redtenbacheri TaxID=93214 RepID=UPI002FDEB335